METFPCLVKSCTKTFTSHRSRNRHMKYLHFTKSKSFECGYRCGRSYKRNDSRKKHEKTCLNNPNIMIGHGVNQQFFHGTVQSGNEMKLMKSAHGGNHLLYKKVLNKKRNLYNKLNAVLMNDIQDVIRKQEHNVKFIVTVSVIYYKELNENMLFTDPAVFFKSQPVRTIEASRLEDILEEIFKDLWQQIEDYVNNGSGWMLYEIKDVYVQIITYDPLRASKYLALPNKLKKSRFILNILNEDDKCALWCILAKLFPKYVSAQQTCLSNNPIHYHTHENDIDVSDIEFPLQINDITKIEKKNNLAINVFTIDEKQNIIPLRITNHNINHNKRRIIDLLYLSNNGLSHYYLITDLEKLCKGQYTGSHSKHFLCRRCLHYFSSEETFSTHTNLCSRLEPQMTVFPQKNDENEKDKLRFTKIERQLVLPFFIVADFETILVKYDTCLRNPMESNTNVLDQHFVCGASYIIICSDLRFFQLPVLITKEEKGKSIVEQFLDSILYDVKKLRKMLKYPTPMRRLSKKEKIWYNTPNVICHICKKNIKEDEIKVKDHCHLTGNFRGPAHQECNLNLRINAETIQIPCFFHNLKNFDGHLLIREVKSHHGEVKIIPSTTEKYISFSIGGVIFKDSYAFTQESLDSLTKILDPEQFLITRRWLEYRIINEYEDSDDNDNETDIELKMDTEINETIENCLPEYDYRRCPYEKPVLTMKQQQVLQDDFNLFKSKGIYPYEYMTSFKKFEEHELPPREAFTSQLNGGLMIEEDEYDHAIKVFKHFGCDNLQEYHDLYLIQDVLLLSDILLAFRNVCISAYDLDPMHYYTAPGLTWDAGLKYCRVTLDLLTDEEMFLFIESSMRGGISVISHRHAIANHIDYEKYGYFNPSKPNQQILYVDCNNLYGIAMEQPLPISDFKFVKAKDSLLKYKHLVKYADKAKSWILSIEEDNEDGYIMEIDCKIPISRHKNFTNYPLAPEKSKINGKMLSPYQRELLKKKIIKKNNDLTEEMINHKLDSYQSCEKLILNLYPKERYIVHYRTLQLYLNLGLEITKIHRVLSFKQQRWLAPYIKANTEMRQKASNDFEKNFFKLMNNAFFGKTMENVRKRRNIELVNSDKKLKKLVSQPTFKSITSFQDNLSAVERLNRKVVLDKPIYIGYCVLDLSKFFMYDFYYNVLEQVFPKLQLLFTDTDSLCVSITGSKNVYKEIRNSIVLTDKGFFEPTLNYFDLSNYCSDHVIFNKMNAKEINFIKNRNKKIPGKFKDEAEGYPILEFIGLRAKSYAFKRVSKNDCIIEEKKTKRYTKRCCKKKS